MAWCSGHLVLHLVSQVNGDGTGKASGGLWESCVNPTGIVPRKAFPLREAPWEGIVRGALGLWWSFAWLAFVGLWPLWALGLCWPLASVGLWPLVAVAFGLGMSFALLAFGLVGLRPELVSAFV